MICTSKRRSVDNLKLSTLFTQKFFPKKAVWAKSKKVIHNFLTFIHIFPTVIQTLT